MNGEPSHYSALFLDSQEHFSAFYLITFVLLQIYGSAEPVVFFPARVSSF